MIYLLSLRPNLFSCLTDKKSRTCVATVHLWQQVHPWWRAPPPVSGAGFGFGVRTLLCLCSPANTPARDIVVGNESVDSTHMLGVFQNKKQETWDANGVQSMEDCWPPKRPGPASDGNSVTRQACVHRPNYQRHPRDAVGADLPGVVEALLQDSAQVLGPNLHQRRGRPVRRCGLHTQWGLNFSFAPSSN